jgi:CheY-like chemotaxis protein
MSSGTSRALKRVLIVDDSADNRRLVAACLCSVIDVVAEEAADGWSALRMIVKGEPDLIILDMNLPVLSGYLTARMVRAWGGRFANLPILALTAAAEPDARAQCLRAGASDYMAKPLIDPTALRAKVCAALGHRSERTEQ